MKKIISIILALCASLCLIVGCTPADENTDTDTSIESVSESETEDKEKELIIAADGQTKFTIWVEQSLWSERLDVKDQVNTLREFIKTKTGVTLSVSGDRYFTDADEDKPAILIGRTKSSATPTPDTSLKIGDFLLGMKGNKIYIYAEHGEGAVTGVKYFINKVLSPQLAGDTTLSFKESQSYEYSVDYGISSIKCLGAELGEYTVVIPKNADVNEKLLAYALRYYLITNYGYDLTVTDDSAAESDKEILIGNTSRTTVTPEANKYIVSAANGKLQINADGMLGFENLKDYLLYDLFKSGVNAEYVLNDGFVTNGEAKVDIADGTHFVTNREGDIRYMVYNVYGYGEGAPMTIRQQLQIELIKAYLPDVVGFQEYTPSYHTSFTPMLLALGYTQVEADTTVDGTEYENFTPMFYRADKLTAKASGFDIQTNANPKELSKTTTWSVFEMANGKQFAAITAHFMWSGDAKVPNYLELRKEHAADIVALAEKLKTEYSVPVIFGGDLNCNVESDPVKILLEGGLQLAQTLAPEDNKNNNNGHHGHAIYDKTNQCFQSYFTPTGKYTGSIDHLLATSDATVVGFGTLCNDYAVMSSDHSPLIMEITLP